MATPPLDRRRRVKRRLITIGLYFLVVLSLAWFFESQATTTIVFVRHAEKAANDSEDPSLSAAGKARARELSRQMQFVDVDRGVDVIYASQFKRSEETVRPLSIALGKQILRYVAADTVAVLEEILRDHKGEISLIAAHSDTIKPMIEELGGSKHLTDIAEDEYDNVYVVVLPWFGKVKTLRWSYGTPYLPPAGEAQ